jgi:hypothetical protein
MMCGCRHLTHKPLWNLSLVRLRSRVRVPAVAPPQTPEVYTLFRLRGDWASKTALRIMRALPENRRLPGRHGQALMVRR